MMSSWTLLNPSNSVMEVVSLMNDYVTLLMSSVLFMVLINMIYTFYFYSFNQEFYENHELELVWTISPFLLLLIIVLPSLSSLYLLDSCFFCGLSLSIMGHQWYWSYFYKDLSDFFMDSYMLPSMDSDVRLLDVDNRLVVPAFTPIRCLVSSSDVIHSWALPSLSVKMDAIPGRINQFCFSCSRTGIFFGQCSEICGANHSFMPIVMESVSPSSFFHSLEN